jgi:UDP-N-acetylglucosamine 4-epimerase
MKVSNKRVLVTGGAGFIGSNLVEDLLLNNNYVVCLDNFSTGHHNNIKTFLNNSNFKLINGDIRNISDCKEATKEVEIVFHQAALGSVPRSIENPITSNEVNVSGFLNMLVASRDNKVKRLVYAASSSTYGDSIKLPKIEEEIGKPLSPYAVTKYVNELYAHVFGINYGLEIIGLRYFNVFGRRQDPNGSYAAVIPKFLNLLMKEQSPIVNGDGSFSRDFTYIDNVILMNHLAAITTNKEAIGQVFNTAVGERNTLKDLIEILKKELSNYNPTISKVEAIYGVERSGDIPHSLASIDKAVKILGYLPSHHFEAGIKETIKWYWNNLNN